ncbi:MAG: hypothetical protein IAE87_19770 [Rhodobacteraceae bacterium]|jgi:hypothetical protein|nr:hypothetical protein [Paracoccaceae bacterium]
MIPPRVLLANSCGIGRGHMVNLRIAAEALGPGFAYDAALARTGHADELSGPLGARVIRAPALGFGPHSQATPARGASASWGQYLADIGLCRDDLVRNQLRWWRQRIIDSDAAVLIADVAPLALLAARGLKAEGWQIETILAGTGYSAPPADLPAYPILLPDVTTLGHDETALLDRLNRILADEGIPGLATLPDILRSDTPFTTSLPLFDAYDGSRGDWPVLPPLERLPPQAGSGEEVFVYVSTAAGRNPAVLDLLADLPLPRRGYIPGLAADQAARLAASGMVLSDRPLPLEEIAARARLFVNLGQHGTLIMGALMGVPQVALTQHLEHLFHARRLEAQGCCLVRRPHQIRHEEVRAAILAAHGDAGMSARARRLAATLRADQPADVRALRAARLAPAAERARSYA